MAKHVCPVCETVYVEKGTLQLEVINQVKQYECWECPTCGYKFMSLSDVQELFDILMGKDAPSIMDHIQVRHNVLS
jgi:Zn ribbon nucleic-acid-binding protein